MSRRASVPAQRPEEALSFFRYAKAAEMEAGAMPLVFWSVEPSGDYMADVGRGKAIANELLAYVVASPTNGNMTLLSSVLLDMQRFGSTTPKGVLVGFGRVMMNSALIGAVVAGIHGFSEIMSPYSEGDDAASTSGGNPAADTATPAKRDPMAEAVAAHAALNEEHDRCAARGDEIGAEAACAGAMEVWSKIQSDDPPAIESVAGAMAAVRFVVDDKSWCDQDHAKVLRRVLAYFEGSA